MPEPQSVPEDYSSGGDTQLMGESQSQPMVEEEEVLPGLQRPATEPVLRDPTSSTSAHATASSNSQPSLESKPSSKRFFTQKRSIFKSKSANAEGNAKNGSKAEPAKKGRSLYKHNWNQDDADKSKQEEF